MKQSATPASKSLLLVIFCLLEPVFGARKLILPSSGQLLITNGTAAVTKSLLNATYIERCSKEFARPLFGGLPLKMLAFGHETSLQHAPRRRNYLVLTAPIEPGGGTPHRYRR